MIVPLKAAYQILDSDSATVGDVLKCFGQLSQHFNGLEREETRVQMDKAIEVHTMHVCEWRNVCVHNSRWIEGWVDEIYSVGLEV